MDGKPDISKFIKNTLIKEKKIIPPNNNIQMLKNKHFEMIVPICYHYRKQTIIRLIEHITNLHFN
jgi:hypothetical protein